MVTSGTLLSMIRRAVMEGAVVIPAGFPAHPERHLTTVSRGGEDRPSDRHLAGCGAAAGRRTVTRSPPAARGVRVRVPSWARAMLLTIARPRPTPAASVRTRSLP